MTCSPLKAGPSAHHDVGVGRSRSSAIRVAWTQFETWGRLLAATLASVDRMRRRFRDSDLRSPFAKRALPKSDALILEMRIFEPDWPSAPCRLEEPSSQMFNPRLTSRVALQAPPTAPNPGEARKHLFSPRLLAWKRNVSFDLQHQKCRLETRWGALRHHSETPIAVLRRMRRELSISTYSDFRKPLRGEATVRNPHTGLPLPISSSRDNETFELHSG